MLMDNMAYLQQIAGVDNSLNNPSKKGGLKLPSFINVWTMLGAVLLIIVIVVVMVITAAMNKVDSKDPNPQIFTSKIYFKFLSMNNKTMNKLDLYEKNGYLLGKNLLIFHETSSAPLNMSVIDQYIQEYLL